MNDGRERGAETVRTARGGTASVVRMDARLRGHDEKER